MKLLILSLLLMTTTSSIADETDNRLDEVTAMCAAANASASKVMAENPDISNYYHKQAMWWSYHSTLELVVKYSYDMNQLLLSDAGRKGLSEVIEEAIAGCHDMRYGG